MIDEKFDVIFRGQLVKGKEADEVKANLAKLFKSSVSAVEPLFSGSDTAIKKSIDYSTAMKYQTALKQAGALAIIQEVIVAKPKANFLSPEENVEESSNEPTDSEIINESQSSNAEEANNNKSINDKSESENQDGLTIAAAGAQLMPNKIYEKRDVDTSELSLAGVGERIMPAKAPENHPHPSIDHLSLES